MSYHYKRLNNNSWGIFIKKELLATIGCVDTCKKIIQSLENTPSDKSTSS